MAGRARGVRGAERGGQDDARTWSRVLRNPAPDPRSVARLMPKPRVLQTHTVTPARAPGCGPCGVGLTSGVQAAETPPLLPEPHPGVPPPKIPELLPSVCRTEEPTVTCQPPPDVHTCAHRPGTHMPSTDKRNSSQTIQINHTDSAHYENSMHVSTCTHSAGPAGTFMQTYGHLQLPHIHTCSHAHTAGLAPPQAPSCTHRDTWAHAQW